MAWSVGLVILVSVGLYGSAHSKTCRVFGEFRTLSCSHGCCGHFQKYTPCCLSSTVQQERTQSTWFIWVAVVGAVFFVFSICGCFYSRTSECSAGTDETSGFGAFGGTSDESGNHRTDDGWTTSVWSTSGGFSSDDGGFSSSRDDHDDHDYHDF